MSESSQSLAAQAEELKSQFLKRADEVKQNPSAEAVESLRIDYMGRKGSMAKLMEGLRNVGKDERPAAGKALNELRQTLESKIESLKASASAHAMQVQLNKTPVDISLPVQTHQGSLHPVSLMRQKLTDVFHGLGFTIFDGPEIDHEFFNFNALNMPDHHPARDMQDTFYVKDMAKTVLRTHTSNIQIHVMKQMTPPLRAVAMGRVYRCDSDMTHTPMFHQVEGFVVAKGIHFGHLKGTIDAFLREIFGAKLETRFRPSYFPFVEPGAEMDLRCFICSGKGCRVCSNSGWIEIGGCGMIHPNVFESVGYDSEKYTGFAFGFGIDRVAMLRYRLPDLRQLFEGNHPFLKQFPSFQA